MTAAQKHVQPDSAVTRDAPDLSAMVDRFLATGHPPAQPQSPDTVTHELSLSTPAGWRDGSSVDLRVHQRGDGPAVLLVHGWRGQATDLALLADRLVADGYTVWMPDLPGHGHSGGKYLSLPLAAAALHATQSLAGPFAFAAAHSYGGAGLVQALATGLQVQRVALLAPPTHYGHFARYAAAQAGLAANRLPEWLDALSRTIGADPDTFDMRRQVRGLAQPALLIHSEDDSIVAFDAVQAVAQAWTGARWWPRQGLGHFKLLRDDETLHELVEFANGQ